MNFQRLKPLRPVASTLAVLSSSRLWAVVSPGWMCEGWMESFVPRSTRISAVVAMIVQTSVKHLELPGQFRSHRIVA